MRITCGCGASIECGNMSWGQTHFQDFQRKHEDCSKKMAKELSLRIAHRAVGNQEQDVENGKLAGFCLVCQVPWPCEYAIRAERGE
jgi:hypothetical protein